MNWPLVKISEFCSTGSGGTPSRKKPEYYEGSIPWIKSGDLREKTVTNATEYISEAAIKNSSAKIVPSGAILLAMYGATVGRMAELGIDAATNQAVCSIIPENEKAFGRYVYYALQSKVPEFLSNAVGGAQPNINQGIIKDTKIPLPPLKEQKRIAAILDKADAIRRKRQQAIDLTDQLLRSVFLDMFGDPVTNPKGWNRVLLDDICRKVTDGTHHSPTPQDEGIPYITAKHLKPNHLDFYSKPTFVSEDAHKAIYARCNPEFNDVLYIKDGATTGAAALNPYKFEFSMLSSLALIKTNEEFLLPEFLCDWLNFESVKERALRNISGAAITRLTIRKIKDLIVELPPIEQQLEYKKIRNEILKSKKKLNKSISDSEKLFSSLTQQAFKGELTKQTKAA